MDRTEQKPEKEPIRTADGIDITEGVQILYDIAHSSMDWGSGFLDNAEMETVIRLAITMGWQVPNLPENSPAMQTVAQKFPEHYEITTVQIPPSAFYPDGFERLRIRVIRPTGGES